MFTRWIIIIFMYLGGLLNAESSPIIDYRAIHSGGDQQKHRVFNIYELRYVTAIQITPLLRSICNDCRWYIDHPSQRIGLNAKPEDWERYEVAIKIADKKLPMVSLKVDVIEIADISNESYQQLLYKLAQPMTMDSATELTMEIEYMLSSGNANLVSSPRVLTKSGQEAIIMVGDKIPYATVYTTTSSSVRNMQYIDSGIELNITPMAHLNQQIDLKLKLEYQTVNGYRREDQFEMPMFASRSTEMNIQVTSNMTVIFAGLIDQSSHYSIEKVPVLGDLPIIGGLFRRSTKKQRNTDLIYKVTPSLIY